MLITDATFQAPTLWLKVYVPYWQDPLALIAEVMTVTDATFQAPTSWLKEHAPLNMLAMFETDATFHFETSSLNVGLLAKTDAMLVTAAVFQSPIGPYVVVAVLGLVIHAVTAVPMLPSVMAVHAAHVGIIFQLPLSPLRVLLDAALTQYTFPAQPVPEVSR
jgi:hypothetical protein